MQSADKSEGTGGLLNQGEDKQILRSRMKKLSEMAIKMKEKRDCWTGDMSM